jgi:hypothetical protein
VDDDVQAGPEAPGSDFVQFRSSGERAKGAFRCAGCGYGVAVSSALPVCPMCGGSTWEAGDWSPFSRAEPLL